MNLFFEVARRNLIIEDVILGCVQPFERIGNLSTLFAATRLMMNCPFDRGNIITLIISCFPEKYNYLFHKIGVLSEN